MSSTDKIHAEASTELLVEMDEPEAWLEALRRIAHRRQLQLKSGSMSDEAAAARWGKLARALAQTQANLDEGDAPGRGAPAPDAAQVADTLERT